MEFSSSAFFSREQTHTLRFCRQREAAARFLSRKRCRRSSGSSSAVRRRRPPVGWAGENWREGQHGQDDTHKRWRRGNTVRMTPIRGGGGGEHGQDDTRKRWRRGEHGQDDTHKRWRRGGRGVDG